jgi:hypothetical protein
MAVKRRYVVTARWDDGSIEQVDVDCDSAGAARRDAEATLRRDYEPDWKVVAVSGPMVGLYGS